jgi:hypothetical protein
MQTDPAYQRLLSVLGSRELAIRFYAFPIEEDEVAAVG